jgi:hypothetical protein
VSDSTASDPIAQVASTHAKVVTEFMQRQNVVACGVGYKVKGNQPTSVPSIVVSVTQKKPADTLAQQDLIPQSVEDVPTDVVETGPIVAYALDRRSKVRPARPGVSVGHFTGNTGTLGCLVRQGSDLFIVSNNHVLASLNAASRGDPIIQPGLADGGTPGDKIGELVDFVPLSFLDVPAGSTPASQSAQSTEPQGCAALISGLFSGLGKVETAQPAPVIPQLNTIDVALARLSDSGVAAPDIVDVGGPPLGIADAQLGMRVIKSGRTSGLTQGVIMQIDVTVDVQYDARKARFANQIMVTPFSEPGDSGSLVLDYERNAVGLLFSGSSLITVVNPIRPVLTALRVELVTEGTG